MTTEPMTCRWCEATSTGLCAHHLAEALRAGARAQQSAHNWRVLALGLAAALVGVVVALLRGLP